MVDDLEALAEIAEFFDKHTEMGKRYEFGLMLDQFRKSLLRELDYRQEAHNLSVLRVQLKDFEHIIVPAPISDYCTSRVLTMEYVPGVKITEMSPIGPYGVRWRRLGGRAFPRLSRANPRAWIFSTPIRTREMFS